MSDEEFRQLYRLRSVAVARRAARLVGDPALAEDLMHEAFMALHRVCGEGRVPQAPYPWLYRTVTNLALNHIRDTRTHAKKLRRQADEVAFEQAEGLLDQPPDAGLFFAQTLRRVDPAVAEVASYFLVDGMTVTEISELLGTSRRSVNRTLQKYFDAAEPLVAPHGQSSGLDLEQGAARYGE